ncbi:hypothetical protein BHE74_00032406 [Ensete ventricosum]|uniref:Alpha-glucan water dikinase phosphohistidine-like domain-containing protein n=1 Tax=Ensete ventricosum TaxID=4639 RepID=A0A427AC70_ENSVE|nr:hypothetical protein B296_00032995 [Ensete ventricosum]RWW60588.1 hypothetical protein BHE74_00032406 [Ensete ventricosum]RZS09631.1 hypothetical protein BHM03_00040731 [Ensete ventricosum]
MVPPSSAMPSGSVLLDKSCETPFTEASLGDMFYQVEISKAQDRLTDLLQNVYKDFPQHREILRMIMSSVGRGGEGDVGQRIRDEILVIQVFHFDIPAVFEQDLMRFILEHVEDKVVEPLLEALLEARVELRPLLLNSSERLKDLIFLDIALDSTVRTAVERAYEELNNAESEPTILVAKSVKGEEEIPDGTVAVLTPDMPDFCLIIWSSCLWLLHYNVATMQVCFATCFDANILAEFQRNEGKLFRLKPTSADIVYR